MANTSIGWDIYEEQRNVILAFLVLFRPNFSLFDFFFHFPFKHIDNTTSSLQCAEVYVTEMYHRILCYMICI